LGAPQGASASRQFIMHKPVMPLSPRLQLRWEASDEPSRFGDEHPETKVWICHYELVIPLEPLDIRRERYDDAGNALPDVEEKIVSLNVTKRQAVGEPCRNARGGLVPDTPFRDHSHSLWDAAKLGGLPIYAVTIDGLYLEASR